MAVTRPKQAPLRRILRDGNLEAVLADGGNILFNDRREANAAFNFLRKTKVVNTRKRYEKLFKRYHNKYRTLPDYSKEDAIVNFLTDIDRNDLIDGAVSYIKQINGEKKDRKLFQGVKGALQKIHAAGIKFIIMTDAGVPGKDLWKYIEGWGIDPYVTDIVSSVDVKATKPAIEFFDYVLDGYSLNKKGSVFVAHAKDELDGACELEFAVLACRPDRSVEHHIVAPRHKRSGSRRGFMAAQSFKYVPEALQIRDSA